MSAAVCRVSFAAPWPETFVDIHQQDEAGKPYGWLPCGRVFGPSRNSIRGDDGIPSIFVISISVNFRELINQPHICMTIHILEDLNVIGSSISSHGILCIPGTLSNERRRRNLLDKIPSGVTGVRFVNPRINPCFCQRYLEVS